MAKIKNFVKTLRGRLNYRLTKWGLFGYGLRWKKVDVCGGPFHINGYCNIDICPNADIHADLEKKLLPFKDSSIDTVICISAINYFSRERGEIIVKEVFRILKKGGLARFATQDLKSIAQKYVNKDMGFFFQKLPSGKERFRGVTMADKINSWFYGYKTTGEKTCKYFYDFETLALIFKKAGFSKVEKKDYMQSDIPEIKDIDNRPDQMFFLEAVK